VRLERDDTLRVAVHDDGAGIGADALVGVGLTSIRERATELGGASQVRSDGRGGTTVTAQLPLPSRTEAAR
jgi:signal transduction histidine kinase